MARRLKRLIVSTGLVLAISLPIMLVVVGCTTIISTPRIIDIAPSKETSKNYAYDYLFFEIAPVTSASPDRAALEHFRHLLDDYNVCRADKIMFLIYNQDGPPYNVWDETSITLYEAIRRELNDPDPQDRVGLVFVSYVDGPFLYDKQVKNLGGLQYSDSSFAIFLSGARNTEAAVLLHEFCHMFGLRKDQKDEPLHHCPNWNCAMYPSVGSAYSVLCDECYFKLQDLIAERIAGQN